MIICQYSHFLSRLRMCEKVRSYDFSDGKSVSFAIQNQMRRNVFFGTPEIFTLESIGINFESIGTNHELL